jgi:DNA-binding NtrC family response regulator
VAGSAALADGELVVAALGRGSDVVALAALGSPPLERLVAPLRLALRFLAHELFRDAFREAGPLTTEPLPLGFPGDLVVGRAPAMQRTYAELRRIAGHRLPVLLLGEPGSGKLELARLLHASSAAAGAPFLVVDCGERDETIERRLRELTGAGGRGRAGTVVLRHVDALPPPVQPRLVAALDALRESDRVAGSHPPRVVATLARGGDTARDGNALPQDLYYRLAGFELRVPPLRQRREDVPLLFDHFLCREMGPRRPGLSAEALAALLAHRWEGNLRELQHEAVRVAARVDGPVIQLAQLSPAVRDGEATAVEAPGPTSLELAERFRAVERQSIGQALAETNGHLTSTAELLGISRSRLRRRMRELGIARAS